MNAEEFDGFEQHPIKAFDPFYTRDTYLFNCIFDDYRREVRERAKAAANTREFNSILNAFVDCISKIKTYERATNTKFISYEDSSGRLRQNRSYLDLLDI